MNFSLATSDKWKDKRTGDAREETQWHRCSAFGRTAEVVAEYARKGSPLLVEGSIRYGKFTDRDGVERTTTTIRVERVVLLGTGRRESDPTRNENQASGPAPTRAPAPATSSGASGFDDMDDDIPF